MLPFAPIKTLLEIGEIKVYTWGFLISLGILLGSLLIIKEAKRKNINQEKIIYSIILTILCQVFFMKLAYNLVVLKIYNFQALNILNTGSASFGAIVGMIVGLSLSALIFKINFWKLSDTFMPGLILGGIITRLGCHISGDPCSYGLEMQKVMPWAIYYNNALRHPTALYELAMTLPLFILIWKLRKKVKKGYLFLTTVALYSIIRLIVNFYRLDMSSSAKLIPLYFLAGTILIIILKFISSSQQ